MMPWSDWRVLLLVALNGCLIGVLLGLLIARWMAL